MSYACVYSRACYGMSAPLISVEVHLSAGLPNFSIVGLPEKALKESKDRVRSAILNSNFDFPMQRITVNLAPADLPKQGGRFDLAIALGILIASQQVKTKVLAEYEFAAELALDGHLRSIKAALPFAIATQAAKRKLIIAIENSDEVKLARHLPAFSAQTLLEVCAHLQNETTLPNIIGDISVTALHDKKDLNEVKKYGKIIMPFLGVKYVLISKEMAAINKLPVNDGALVVREALGESPVVKGSSADKAGIKEWDIIIECNNEGITIKNPLAHILQKCKIGGEITIKVLRDGKKLELKAKLEEKV